MKTKVSRSSLPPAGQDVLPFLGMGVMVVASFFNFFGLNIAGASVLAGIATFFICKWRNKQPYTGSGLDLGSMAADLKNVSIWFWIALPIIMNILSLWIAKVALPEYVEYETGRAGAFVAIELSVVSTLQFLFFALGEEIAWRAFFQRQLNKVMPIVPTLLASSLLFAFGHYQPGPAAVVAFNLFFVFINSILYGIVFDKTKNAWVSTLSHFAANMFSVIVIVLFF
ncbi:MAG: CPBP family intramembrane metalloprotease [Limnochordia bacterium]|jgi:membrane protease YdiL (CAAX protease family)|nr:CPBP family intramembrane metalloprotease [Limnochordia bacterium]